MSRYGNAGPRTDQPIYLKTPSEHNRALCEAAIRAVEQLTERLVRPGGDSIPQPTEQELAFIELALRRILRELP